MLTIKFKNKMQRGSYVVTARPGAKQDGFRPALTPRQMLRLGVFEGLYLNSAQDEYPTSWFVGARLSLVPDVECNAFSAKSRLPLSAWQEQGWINPQDPRGWFEWYCRFYQGRRTEDDARQIKRWRAFVRHSAQVMKHGGGDVSVRPAQRQALLQWSHDPLPDVKPRPHESTYAKIQRVLQAQR